MKENREILSHFQKADPKLYPHIERMQAELTLTKLPPEQYFYRLCRSIAFQQLSGKAATTIWNRLEALLPQDGFNPENILQLEHTQMRACGLSNAKASYIHNIAQAFSEDANYDQLDQLSDAEVIELLTKIKGVGKWTAEMFLMFTLARPDVFSAGDWGLIKGMMKVYGMKSKPSKKRVDSISRKWAPYRTFASLALWEAIDGESDISS